MKIKFKRPKSSKIMTIADSATVSLSNFVLLINKEDGETEGIAMYSQSEGAWTTPSGIIWDEIEIEGTHSDGEQAYQVLNQWGRPASNDQNALAIFPTKEKAKAYIEYLFTEIGVKNCTIKPVVIK